MYIYFCLPSPWFCLHSHIFSSFPLSFLYLWYYLPTSKYLLENLWSYKYSALVMWESVWRTNIRDIWHLLYRYLSLGSHWKMCTGEQMGLSHGELKVTFLSTYVFPSPVLTHSFVFHACLGLTQALGPCCLQISSCSFPSACRVLMCMVWGSMCINNTGMTWIGGLGPYLPGIQFLMRWASGWPLSTECQRLILEVTTSSTI